MKMANPALADTSSAMRHKFLIMPNLKAGKLASKEEYLPLLTELYYVGYKKNELEVCQFARI